MGITYIEKRVEFLFFWEREWDMSWYLTTNDYEKTSLEFNPHATLVIHHHHHFYNGQIISYDSYSCHKPASESPSINICQDWLIEYLPSRFGHRGHLWQTRWMALSSMNLMIIIFVSRNRISTWWHEIDSRGDMRKTYAWMKIIKIETIKINV